MAKRATKQAANGVSGVRGAQPAKRKGPDPTGRVDLLAIRLLEHAVATFGDLPLRGIYGTYKRDIDRTIKRHLGRVRFYFPDGTASQLGLEGPHAR